MVDISDLLTDLDSAVTAVDDAQTVVDAKQAGSAAVRAQFKASLDKADAELATAATAHQAAVDAANKVRLKVNEQLAAKLGVDDGGRVR